MPSKLWQTFLILLLSTLLFSGCTFLDRKRVAALQVITHEVNCAVFLDDQYLDKTPVIDKNIKPGTYTLKIEPNNPDLATYQTQITLKANLLTVVTWRPRSRPETSGGVIYELEPIAGNQGQLAFITVPDNVLVKLDEREQQFSPVTFKEVEPGLHKFKLSLTAYEKQEHTINVPKGHRVTVTAKLARVNEEELILNDSQATSNVSTRNATIAAQLQPNQATASSLASASATVTIKSTNFFQDEEEVLRVRSEPTPNSEQLGLVIVGQNYPYLDQTENNWHLIGFEDKIGWVSAQFSELNLE